MHCPNCNSDGEIYDRGLKRVLRLAINNNRYYCPKCLTTWRNLTPHLFQKMRHLDHIRAESEKESTPV